jgi:hypothetical protein
MNTYAEDTDRGMTRDEMKAWRCKCGAGPEKIVWTETVDYVRHWDGDRFVSVTEDPSNIEFKCGECGADVPRPGQDLINEAIND